MPNWKCIQYACKIYSVVFPLDVTEMFFGICSLLSFIGVSAPHIPYLVLSFCLSLPLSFSFPAIIFIYAAHISISSWNTPASRHSHSFKSKQCEPIITKRIRIYNRLSTIHTWMTTWYIYIYIDLLVIMRRCLMHRTCFSSIGAVDCYQTWYRKRAVFLLHYAYCCVECIPSSSPLCQLITWVRKNTGALIWEDQNCLVCQ